MKKILRVAEILVICVGVFAALHLASLRSGHPWVRVVEVEGVSMEPTFHQGDRLLFVRCPWSEGDVVLAEVGVERPVIKRIVGVADERVHLLGDNRELTEEYYTQPQAVRAVFICRFLSGDCSEQVSARSPS